MRVLGLLLLTFVFAAQTQPQSQPPLDQVTSKEFLIQLLHDGVYFFISAKVAESLVVHRVEPTPPHGDTIPRVSGTVIVAFELTKEGKIRHPMAVSGPKLLQPAALSAVRQWTLKPFELNGESTTVATTVPLTFSNY